MARWYIIHSNSGFESKVKESILANAARMGLNALVEQIEVPAETVPDTPRSKKVSVERKFMPGYVLAKLSMNDDVYHLVKNTPKVTGFLGLSGKPQPISEAQAARILHTDKAGKDVAVGTGRDAKSSIDYEIGDLVQVLDGPFAGFSGNLEELDFDQSRVKITVSIFGRATPIELDFDQVVTISGKKINDEIDQNEEVSDELNPALLSPDQIAEPPAHIDDSQQKAIDLKRILAVSCIGIFLAYIFGPISPIVWIRSSELFLIGLPLLGLVAAMTKVARS